MRIYCLKPLNGHKNGLLMAQIIQDLIVHVQVSAFIKLGGALTNWPIYSILDFFQINMPKMLLSLTCTEPN